MTRATPRLVLLGAIAFAGAAHAQQSSLGFAGGIATFDEFCDAAGGPGVSCDEQAFGLKGFIGGDATEHLRFEAFYTYSGEFEASDGSADVTVDASGIGVALMPMVAASDRVDLFARAGFWLWDAEVEAASGGLSATDTADGTDPVLGLGGRIGVNERTSIRVEWEQYDLDDTEFTLLSVGAEFTF